ncbi:B-type cyclin, partial [Oleoguttula sp. CCFEE 5521]
PQRPRALRVHDENMPPPALNAAGNAKTLHQRTKSVPAFATFDNVKAANKKVLGEANANVKLTQPAKDDSALDKKKAAGVEVVKVAATFTRPATRPLGSKSFSHNTMPSVIPSAANFAPAAPQSQTTEAVAEQAKKVTAKKSTKVLRETDNVLPKEVVPAPAVISTAPAAPVQHQIVRKTETVPLRDEPAPRPVSHQAQASLQPPAQVQPQLPTQVEQSYLPPIAIATIPAVQPPHAVTAVAPVQQAHQYYDDTTAELYYDDGNTTGRSFGLRGDSTGGVTTVYVPTANDRVKQELAVAEEYVVATRTPEDIEDELWDTSMVAEYGDEIFAYMRSLEARMSPNPRYMESQQEIQWSMRAVLIDWVVQVHSRFNLLPETLFLTINYIDRFLSCKIVSLGKLQLVGATAIFVAAKYEEVNCPTIQEIIYMVDGGYTVDELLKAERFMLSMLQFELGWPGPMSFLRRISKADDYDLETRTLAKYFLEVTIMDERFVGCTPSFLAAGAHCMARLMLQKGDWGHAHAHYSGYTYTQLGPLLHAILECCEDPRKHHLAVFEKYVDKRYKKASTFVETEMGKNFQLPRAVRGASLLSPIDALPNGWR